MLRDKNIRQHFLKSVTDSSTNTDVALECILQIAGSQRKFARTERFSLQMCDGAHGMKHTGCRRRMASYYSKFSGRDLGDFMIDENCRGMVKINFTMSFKLP